MHYLHCAKGSCTSTVHLFYNKLRSMTSFVDLLQEKTTLQSICTRLSPARLSVSRLTCLSTMRLYFKDPKDETTTYRWLVELVARQTGDDGQHEVVDHY